MNYNLPAHLQKLPIYLKAMDILLVSHRISTYLSQDLSALNEDGTENKYIYFSGDIVQQSLSLAPVIIEADRERYSEKKYDYLEKLEQLTNKLYRNCKRLERSKSQIKEYLPILKGEIKQFKTLQYYWMMSL